MRKSNRKAYMFVIIKNFQIRYWIFDILLSSRRIPNRACIGAFLVLEPLVRLDERFLGQLYAKCLTVIGEPGRRRDLEDTHIVEGTLAWVKGGIFPVCGHKGVANGIREGRVVVVDRIAYQSLAAAVRSDLASVRDCDVIDPFLRFAVLVEPGEPDVPLPEDAGPVPLLP